MAKLVSKVYGDALFDLAYEETILESIMEEIQLVQQVFAENEELLKLFNHPKISKEEKVKVIEQVFKGRCSDTIVGLLVIVVEKGRYNDLNAIFEHFILRYKECHNIGIANIVSAVKLSKKQKAKIEEKLLLTTKYAELEMNFTVDESLIGGLVIRIGDRVVDSSIKTKLKTLSKALA